ncbi:MAG: prephenate dehydrogenase/arogenate dehydrogenase family protein [Verrucomicrobia bacterium]|nr:prephenate dehydrogenase/arogenate dehydrogenase family protein [Verrucomicrobiota bacterium]
MRNETDSSIQDAPFKRKPAIGVVGAGLIGGSIALAAQERGFPVVIHDPYADLIGKVPSSVIVASDLARLADGAQIIFLATPLSALPNVGQQLAEVVSTNAVVSDVGSVKGAIAAGLAGCLQDRAEYVPSHPMAGSEQHGWAAARPSLFKGAAAIICPEFAIKSQSVEVIEQFWTALGAVAIRLSAAEHDRYVGAISHLPHALAAVLSELVGTEIPEAMAVVGPGFRDVTRIAGGAPRLWAEIFLANQATLARYLARYCDRLDRLRTALVDGDQKYLEGVLDAGKRNRDTLGP